MYVFIIIEFFFKHVDLLLHFVLDFLLINIKKCFSKLYTFVQIKFKLIAFVQYLKYFRPKFLNGLAASIIWVWRTIGLFGNSL